MDITVGHQRQVNWDFYKQFKNDASKGVNKINMPIGKMVETFRCKCGCNTFTEIGSRDDKHYYRCNSCRATWVYT